MSETLMTASQFEDRYESVIIVAKELDKVSFGSASMNLYDEYKRLEGDESDFDNLLKEWGLML